MQKEGKLVDPVTQGQKEMEEKTQSEEIKALSIEALTLEDFQPIPETASRRPHPFEGYPQRKIKIGVYKEKGKDVDLIVSVSHLVALNPKEYIHQDPSGKGVTIIVKGQEKIVDLKTFHSRIVKDESGRNIDVVFDREINLGDGKSLGRTAIVPDHTARSQLVFRVEPKKGDILVDRRYILADIAQVSRLRQCFQAFHYQQTRSERLAQKFDEEAESRAQ